MKFEIRTNSDGSSYYSFVYYNQDTRKTVRITKEEIRTRFGNDIIEYDKAVEACKLLDAEIENLSKRIKRRAQWEEEFYQFSQLLNIYESFQRKKAPNSWKNNMHYLKNYVLPFFLNIKKCNNLASWYDYYEEFKIWLEDEAKLLQNPNKLISYGSKNHAIKALNTFMHHLYTRRIITNHFICECFPAKKLNEKGVEEIITIEEMECIYKQLQQDGNTLEALFFRFLYFTGMRFNEGLGIHPKNLYDGEIEDKILQKYLEQDEITYHGYVVFDSQPAQESGGLRNDSGHIKRKPLKGKHKIDLKSARTVVITDKILWNELVSIHNKKLDLLQDGVFGDDLANYPIFEGISKTTSTIKLKKAFSINNLRPRTWHSCRHTRATFLIGKTGNSLLAKLWLGHSSDKVLKRYVHIYEAVIRNVKKKNEQEGSFIKKLRPVT